MHTRQMNPPHRRGLLIVRAGDRSLHPTWLGPNPDARSWDLHISYYGKQNEPYPDRPSDVTLTREPGPKFPGLATCLEKLGDRLERYDYIGLPDDDLLAGQGVWNRVFELALEHKPLVAQPALDPNSFFAYPLLLQRRTYQLRWTNFVEVMTPIFAREALRAAAPDFTRSKSGWGMDYYWPYQFNAENRTMCVFDAAPVLHTRDNGVGPLYKLIDASGGLNPDQEFELFLREKGVTRQEPTVFAGLNRAGVVMENPTEAARPLLIPRIRQGLRRKLSIRHVGAHNSR